jgi:hypothetical protein
MRLIGALVWMDTNVVFGIIYPEDHEDDLTALADPKNSNHRDPNRPKMVVALDRDNPDWLQFAGVEAGLRGVVREAQTWR